MRPIEEVATEICTLAGRINAATFRWLTLIAEFDRRTGWSDSATQSCAHWLNWRCGIALGAAREKVRVARALEGLPKVSAAMESGGLSYSKARELTRIATPENEEFLLGIAEHGTAAHVEKLVRAYRRCQDAEELSREQRQQESRALSYRYDDDGSLVIHGRLPAEAAAQFIKALELAVDQLPAPARVPAGTSAPPRVPFAARRADAFAAISESFLAHGMLEQRGADRHQVVVHVAAETLRDRKAGCCEFEHGPAIAADTARRFSCDAAIVMLVENEQGEPLNVGRKTRVISAPLRRMLNARDQGCRFPGCCNRRYIDIHHVKHWANGGETRPSNLVSLCRFHHHAVHEGGIQIVMLDDGALRFIKANGDPILAPVLPRQVPGAPLDLPAGTLVNRWVGDRMDLGLAVDVLMQTAKRGKNVPAGTSITS